MNDIFQLFQLIASNVWLYGGTFILVLSILVFVHEWGHYIVARLCGVRVEVFSIGFGKELFGLNDKHGTRWKFSIIPLGGYVKMFGDTDPASAGYSDKAVEEGGHVRPMTEDERKEAFFAKPLAKRAAVVFAGPGINFLFAILLLAGLYSVYGQPVTPPVAAAVIIDGAADKAGFEPHDKILRINGKKVNRFEDIRREVMVALDTPMRFEIERQGAVMEITATPEKETIEDHFGFKHARGLLGIIGPGNGFLLENIKEVAGREAKDAEESRDLLLGELGRPFTIALDRGPEVNLIRINPLVALNQGLSGAGATAQTEAGLGIGTEIGTETGATNYLIVADKVGEDYIRHGVLPAIGMAAGETWNITMSTLTALGQMITGTRSPTELGGIIRIGAVAGDMAQAGLIALIGFTALLSINLGLINLFPIPMLDGGHLLFYGIEAVKGSPIPDQMQEYAFRFGLALLVGIMIFANLNDIVQLVL